MIFMAYDLEKSPLELFDTEIDKHNPSSGFWEMYEKALSRDRQYFTNLFLMDLDWRANHQQNALISIEGQQSSGKSLFGMNIAFRLGLFFNFPFIIDRDMFANPYDLDFELRKGERRRTFQYDEQPQRMVGVGSGATKVSLSDWEDIARYTQKNVIYCSPEVLDHSHYFVFQQVEHGIKRLHNDTCRNCPHLKECQTDFYKTMCEKGKVNHGIKFWERDGYPVEFSFLLSTKRLADKLLIPRGVVTLPMVTPATALVYDQVKKKNILDFESFTNKSWNRKLEEIHEFVDEYFDKLTRWKVWGKTRTFGAENNAVIEGWFYTKFTPSRFTKDEVKMFIGLIKQELNSRTNLINSGQATIGSLGKV